MFLDIVNWMKKINWPRLAVIVWFFAFGTGVWADMPNPINLSNTLAFLAFATFSVYYFKTK